MNSPTQLAKDTYSSSAMKQVETLAPAVDVFENSEELLLVADVPGVSHDGIDLKLDKGLLTIQAKRVAETTKLYPIATEHRPRDYFRVFAVPTGIDATKIEAQLRDGVLQLHLPKADSIRPRRIDVKRG